MKEIEIRDAIDRRVNAARAANYSSWTIGITADPDTRKQQHESDGNVVKYWKQWRADTEAQARRIEAHFLAKGMKGGKGGGENPTYVYIF